MKKFGLIVASGLGVSFGLQAQTDVKVSGFVDAQYEWTSQKNNTKGNNFLVNDGAVYFGKKMGAGEVFVDIPFRTKTRSEVTIANDNANFVIGQSKAQAYVGWKYENGFSWRLGQFDALYGFEAADTGDLMFSRSGLIAGNLPVNMGAATAASAIVPTVHTGWTGAYEFSDLLNVQFLISNPSDRGAMVEHNPDFGAKINTKFDIFTASLGGLWKRQGEFDGYLYDLIAGTEVRQWSFNIEATLDKAAVGGAKSRWGSLLQVAYKYSDQLNLGTRFEYTKQDKLKYMSWTVGPQYALSKELTAKIDYTLGKGDDSGTKATGHAAYISAVYRF